MPFSPFRQTSEWHLQVCVCLFACTCMRPCLARAPVCVFVQRLLQHPYHLLTHLLPPKSDPPTAPPAPPPTTSYVSSSKPDPAAACVASRPLHVSPTPPTLASYPQPLPTPTPPSSWSGPGSAATTPPRVVVLSKQRDPRWYHLILPPAPLEGYS